MCELHLYCTSRSENKNRIKVIIAYKVVSCSKMKSKMYILKTLITRFLYVKNDMH